MRATPDDRPQPRGLLAAVQSLGWRVLAELPGREVVVGGVTQPWEADVTFHGLPPDEFTAQAGEFCEKIKATPTADGYDEVLVPGEPEMRARGERLVTGIALPEHTWQSLQTLAGELQVTL